MRTRVAAISFAMTGALALGACGSGSNISKADFVKKGNAICVGAQHKTPSAPSVDLSKSLTRQQFKEVGDFLDAGVKIQNEVIAKLRALGTPTGDDARLKKIYNEADKGAKQVQDAAAAAHAGKLDELRTQYQNGTRTLGSAQNDINAYGLDKCGSGERR